MTIAEKYLKVLEISKIKIYKAEDILDFGRNTIKNAIDEDRELSEDYHNDFMTHFNVNPDWWKSGKEPVLLKNGTPVQKTSDNKVNDAALGIAFKTIMEGGTEFTLIPKSLLQDKHRLVPLEIIERDERQMNKLMDDYLKVNNELNELKALLPKVKKAQQ